MDEILKKRNFILKIIWIVILFALALVFLKIAPFYKPTEKFDKDALRVVIDDKDITNSLEDEVLIQNDVIYMSDETIMKYLENIVVYYDEKYDTTIVTSDKSVGKMATDNNIINVDGLERELFGTCFFSGEKLYVPISSITDVTDVQVEYNEKVIITTPRGMSRAKIILSDGKQRLRAYTNKISMNNGFAYDNEVMFVFDTENKAEEDYLVARNARGDLGYIRYGDIKAKNILYMNQATEIQKKELIDDIKYSLTWEYAENYTPDRTSEDKIKAIDIISPTWLYIVDSNGKLKDTTDTKYLTWAKEKKYELWPALKNDLIDIDEFSELVNDMHKRENLINNILNYAKEREIEGINIDLENMYKEDKKVFSEFVRELAATLRKNGYKVSIDVTIAGGSETYSLCYDRTALAAAVDYIMLMAYDQYGNWSKTAGPNASLDWVEDNIKEMLNYEHVNKDKLFLCVPLYSRYWVINKTTGKLESVSVLKMDRANEYLKAYKDNAVWDEDAGQYVIEKEVNDKIIKIWVDNDDALKEKVELINKYDLAGIATWRWGYEDSDTWEAIDSTMDIQ